ncbi:MAG: discoidin domain-containing protein [Clostridia bacterium]|nr:discoidin domain-containing protein [Clostridia bacterium]
MKKVLSILVVLCMMLSCMSTAFAADYALAINNNVAVMVGSTNAIAWNSIVQTVAPVEENGVMLASVGFVAGGFNAKVEKNGLVTVVTHGNTTAYIVEGNKNVVVNGRVYNPEVAPKVVNGALMLPVTFLGETILGKHVYYDADTKMAVISHRKCLSSRDKEAISTISTAITSASLPEIVIQAPVVEITSGGFGGGFVETGKLTFTSVSANQEPEPENNGMCMIDGSLATRWASQGAGSATLDLGAVKPVTNIKVAVWKPNERSTNYGIEVSDDGRNFTSIFNGGSSGSTYDSYDVNDSIRYVRINTNGTTAGDWASILELEAWNGTAVVTPSGGGSGVTGAVATAPVGSKVALSTSMLNASQTPEAANHAGNLLDGNKGSVWASQGEAYVVIDLGSAKTVSAVGVSMKMYEDDRTIPYSIAVSTDGGAYTEVWSGSSDMMTDEFKYVTFSAPARYVRITAMGNTVSGWNSIAEVEVYSSGAATGVATTTTTTTTTAAAGTEVTNPTGTKVAISASMLNASQTPEANNHAGNIGDGNKSSVWASQGEAYVVIDLGSAKTLSTIGVAMKLYEDDRTIPYKIEVSKDGGAYAEVWSGNSDMMSDATKYVATSETARYVKITAYGNTVSGWNSVAEVEVYTK